MKKIGLILILLATITSIAVFANSLDSSKDLNSNYINSAIHNSSSSEIESISEKTEYINNSVDYNKTVFDDWVYIKDDMPTPFNVISDINNVPYGTAGSSYQEACAIVDMLVLSNNENTISYIEDFMKDMTTIQKDYFSRNWELIMTNAKATFDDNGETVKQILSGFTEPEGAYNLDMSLYSKEKLLKLEKDVEKIFEKNGVTKEWKNYPESTFN